jgi:hypothetical protein
MPWWVPLVVVAGWHAPVMQEKTWRLFGSVWQSVHAVQRPVCVPVKIGKTASCCANVPAAPVG